MFIKRSKPHDEEGDPHVSILHVEPDPTAARYALRPFGRPELGAAVEMALQPKRRGSGRQEREGVVIANAVSDAIERKRLEDELREMIYRDPVTGLVSRRSLVDRASRFFALAESWKTRLALLFVDLVRVGGSEDGVGRDPDDRVLCGVYRRLRSLTRKCDIVARVGEDEFLVFLPRIEDAGTAVAVGRRLAESMQDPVVFEGSLIPVSARVGVSLFPDHATSLPGLMAAADAAAYRLDGTRGEVAIYDQDSAG